MKIPLWNRINESASRSVRRFPMVILIAVASAVVGAILVDEHNSRLGPLLMVLQLGIPLLLAARILTERAEANSLPRYSGAVAHLISLAFLVRYYFHLPPVVVDAVWMRHLQWNACVHLLVAVLPYLRSRAPWGFWNYNLKLLLRFMTAAFFTMVLFGGLSVALLAVDTLLGMNVEDEFYGRLWMILVFGFNTLYFLGGVPDRWEELEKERQYPKVAQVFGQYILAPLVSVYLVILTVYLVKVVVGTVWPSGWIGWLVSSVAVAGILSLLLLFPVTSEGRSKWLTVYQRAFHVLLIPAVIMLIMAISKRIGQYGVTEPRYLLAILALWLAVVAITGAARGRFFMKAIPLSLALVMFFASWGPQGASSVSRHSQLGRLDEMLQQQGRIRDGLMVASDNHASHDQRREISAVLNHLFKYHGSDVLESRRDALLQEKLEGVRDKSPQGNWDSTELSRTTMEYLGLPYIAHWRGAGAPEIQIFRCLRPLVTDIQDFQYLLEIHYLDQGVATFPMDEGELGVNISKTKAAITISCDSLPALDLDLTGMVAAVEKATEEHLRHEIPHQLMEVGAEAEAWRARLLLESLSISKDEEGTKVKNLKGQVLIEFK